MSSTFRRILLLLLWLSVWQASLLFGVGQVIYDNFDLRDGSVSDNWFVRSGKWELKNNKLLVDATGGESFIFFGDNLWQNYVVEVDVTFKKIKNPSRWCSILFRGDIAGASPFSQFPVRFAAAVSNGIEFAVKTRDNWHVRRTAAADIDCRMGHPRKLKVVVKGTEVLSFLDGKPVVASSYCVERSTGCVGLGACGCIVEFDNFKVSRSPDTFMPAVKPLKKCRIISHRGNSAKVPENTLASFKRSLSLGVEGCEFDVRCTKDDHVILMHDATVDRTTNGKGKVAEMMYADIRNLDAGAWRGSKYAGQIVPAVNEVLEMIDGARQVAVIDIKDDATVDEIVRLVAKRSMADRVVMLTANRDLLKRLALMDRSISRAWLCGDFPKSAITSAMQAKWLTDNAINLDVKIVNLNYMLVSPELIEYLHKMKISVWVWTVNDPEIMKCLMDWGVDGITTDRPEVLKILRDAELVAPL